jgi:hypothetical protein
MQGASGIIGNLFHSFFLPQSCHPTPTLPLKRREIVVSLILKGRELVMPLALNGRETV